MTAENASVRALRKLIRDSSIPNDEMPRLARQLGRTGNDRLVAIVLGALVERVLKELILSAMPHGELDLFDPHHPLSTFSAKIEIAYGFGLIDAEKRRNSNYIREIRNAFAHRVPPISFRTKEISDVCKLLTLGPIVEMKLLKPTMKNRFIGCAIRIAGGINNDLLRKQPGGVPHPLIDKFLSQPPEGRPSSRQKNQN
jgi:hypothetical protein